MDTEELSYAIEALLFAQGQPMDFAAIRAALRRALSEQEAPEAPEADEDAPEADEDARQADPLEEVAEAGAPARQASVAAFAAELAAQPADEGDEADEANDEAGGQDAEPTAHAPEIEPFALTPPVIHQPKPVPLTTRVRRALDLMEQRWEQPRQRCGFSLVQVGGGYTFRTEARFGELLRAVREHKPQRLSRPALESLAIVAYRQPVTKPEVDHLRGVDSGGSLKVLLDRRLVAVVGKKEEPGRPLLYGTTADFLSFFNLAGLTDLPSLREFHDLNEDDPDTLRAFENLPDLASLAAESRSFRNDEAIATDDLEAAVASLQRTQGAARAAFLAQGVTLAEEEGVATAPPQPTHH